MDHIYKNKEEIISTLVKNTDIVLDVGFWGQGVSIKDPNWVHSILKKNAKVVYGLDTDFEENRLDNKEHYIKSNAENFSFPVKFDVIFAGDLVEHISNLGLFLDACKHNLKPHGRLIITTPNCFGLFNMAEKITKREPTVNSDHVCYFNEKTLKQLLSKNGWRVVSFDSLYSLENQFKESWKKKTLNVIYRIISFFTTKFIETIVVVTEPVT